MSDVVEKAGGEKRKVGFALGLGIFLMPIVFAWFLLRKGYSTLARVIGFGWLLVFVVAVLSDTGSSSSTSSGGSTQGATNAPAEADASFNIGDKISTKGATVRITSVKTAQAVGNEYLRETASEGGVLVVVDFTLTNDGEKPLNAYERPDIKLMDPSGTEYGPDAGKSGIYATTKDLNAKVFSDLNPGITTKSAEVFEIGASKYDPATWRVMVGDKDHLVKIQ